MAKRSELDLEIINAGGIYMLYIASMVSLAIAFNQGNNIKTKQKKVSEYARKAGKSLERCGITHDFPTEFATADDIMNYVTRDEVPHGIGDIIVHVHNRREELLWLTTCYICLSWESDDTEKKSRITIEKYANEIQIPESVINDCLKRKDVQPLKDWVSSRKPSPYFYDLESFYEHNKGLVWIIGAFIALAGILTGLI